MPIPTKTQTLNNLVTSTFENRRPGLVDNFFGSAPLLAYIRKRESVMLKGGTEIRENGLSFRMKAKAISEELLVDAFEIATDPLQSGAVRAKIIEWVTKVAGNEPAPPKSEVAGGGGFNLSITFAGQGETKIIGGHEPALIEQERS